MKMRKLLAGSVAASLAVTSMATMASAEEKSFDFLTNYGLATFEVGDGAAYDLGDKFSMTDDEFTGKVKSYGLTSVTDDVNLADGWIAFGLDRVAAKNVKIEITGVKGTRTAGSKTYTYDLKAFDDKAFGDPIFKAGGAYETKNWLAYLPVYAEAAPEGGFLPEQFLEITKVKLVINDEKITVGTYNEATYNKWGDSITDLTSAIAGGIYVTKSIAGKWKPEGEKLAQIIADNVGGGYWTSFVSKELKEEYAFLPRTTATEGETINRNDVWVLSDTHAYDSDTIAAFGWTIGDGVDGEGQTYDDKNLGTLPNRFAGLASQMADFFNKQTNGTVTFKFTPPVSGGSGSGWLAGGIPSTEVGIKNMLSSAQTNDFALFINYASTTGSMQAATELDAAAGTVTFVIDEILDDMGGLTKSSLEDVYYGLNRGKDISSFKNIAEYYDEFSFPNVTDAGVLKKAIETLVDTETFKWAEYKEANYYVDGSDWWTDMTDAIPGLYVEKVTLAYEADADVEADIEEDDAEDDATVEEDDDVVEEDDATIEEDDAEEDDAEEDDATEDDAEVNGDVIDTPVVEDDDANPGTGVALAVVPAMVAAAAVVLSKKRK